MKEQLVCRKWSWLLFIAVALTLGLAACQSTEENSGKSQSTNATGKAKPEHPEHPK